MGRTGTGKSNTSWKKRRINAVVRIDSTTQSNMVPLEHSDPITARPEHSNEDET